MGARHTKEEILSFMLKTIVVDKNRVFEMNQENLFSLMNLASAVENRLNQEDGLVPHEIIEEFAETFLTTLS